MADEITSLEEAFGAAKAQLEPTGDLVVDAAGTEDISTTGDDQPEASNPELQTLLNEYGPDVSPESGIDIESPGFWNTPVEVGEGLTVPLSEMRNGFLRQADYTRKTQALAEQRRQSEAALSFFESYTADPQAFARAVGVKHGWISEEADAPAVDVPGTELPTQEQLDERIDGLVEERLRSDPRFETARLAEAQHVLDDKFTEIETSLGVTLPNTVRKEIVDIAASRQNYDLELVTNYWISQQRNLQRSGEQLKHGATGRPQSAGHAASEDVPQEISTFADAVLAAKAELGA